jgi:putative sterol carrier protein
VHRPFTPPWADALCAAVTADADYRAAAAGWSWPVALVLERHPALGYPDDVAVELALDGGACHGARIVPPDAATAPIVLRAPYDVWKALAAGALDPVSAVMGGRLRLARGSVMTLMSNVRAATALIACARAVPTDYPDEDAV